MALKRKKPIFYKKVEYDSKEEVEFVMWLEEAQAAGLVKFWFYQPVVWELLPRQSYPTEKFLKTKTVDKFLLHPFNYTPDFKVRFDESFFATFGIDVLKRIERIPVDGSYQYIENESVLWIDVKGAYNLKNHHRIYSITQKIVFDKRGQFVNIVIPEKLFKKTWVPADCAWMKGRKIPTRRKPYATCKLLSEIELEK